MRNAKYLDAREYAQMLRRGSNLDVADFAEDFLKALENFGDSPEMHTVIDRYSEDSDEKTYLGKIEWLGQGSELLGVIEAMIAEKCPEYKEVDTDDAIADMLTRLRPKQEYDL